jgi:hypothetical protein
MLLAAGLLAVVVALGLGLFDAHLRRIKAWDRPAWTLWPCYRRAAPHLRRVLLLLGALFTWLASPKAAVGVAVGLAAAWGWRLRARSEGSLLRRARREIAELGRRHGGAADHEIHGRWLLGRHPEWGAELVDRIVRDHPSLPALVRLVARMERGWQDRC